MSKPVAGVFALAAKVGPKVLSMGVKLLKAAKFGQLGLAGGSIVAYTVLFSWQFAVLIIVSLFVHESGHIWAMKKCGLKTKGIYFIPFLGAAAVTEGSFSSRREEVFIAIMGPIWGFALAAVTLGTYYLTENPLFAAAASWMALVNLFNLLPINPLDGGRIMKSVAFSLHSVAGLVFLAVGLVAAIALTFYFGIYIFAILFFIGGLDMVFEYKKRLKMPNMSGAEIVSSTVGYALMIVVLFGLMSLTSHIPDSDAAMQMMIG